MRKLTSSAVLLISILAARNLYAVQPLSGFCEDGNRTVALGGLTSTTKVQRSFPSCTVTIYLTGTVTLATIYSDINSTPLANPYTATATGKWAFWAGAGIYDVVLSGGGITAPFTLGSFELLDFGGTSPITYVTFPPYLAKCNGSTNDATAINAAVTALNNVGGGVLQFPTGRTCITNLAINLRDKIVYNGGGWSTVIKTGTPAAATADNVFGEASPAGVHSQVVITNMTIDGNQSNVSYNTQSAGLTDDSYQNCIRFNQVSNSRVSNVHIINCVMNGTSNHNASNSNIFTENWYQNIGKTTACPAGGACSYNAHFDESGINRTYFYRNYVDTARDSCIWVDSIGSQTADIDYDTNWLNACGRDGIEIGNLDNSGSIQPLLRVHTHNNTITGLSNAASWGIHIHHDASSGTGGSCNPITSGTGHGGPICFVKLDNDHIYGGLGGGILIGAISNATIAYTTINEPDIYGTPAAQAINVGSGVTNTNIINTTQIQNFGGVVNNGTATNICGPSSTGAFNCSMNVDPAITVTTANGSSASIGLLQSGVASWFLRNNATTGNIAISQGGSDWLSVVPTTGVTTIGNGSAGSLTIAGSSGAVAAIKAHYSATSSLNFPAVAANSCQDLTFAVSGASDGDTVDIGIPNALAVTTGLQFSGWVTAPNTVAVRACNPTVGISADPAAATVRVDVWKH